jgi:transcriptional regulator with XRE-family HTH domain
MPPQKTRVLVPLPYLRAWRLSQYLTQAALAERAGVHISSVKRLESVERGASLTTVRKLATALNVTPDQLRYDDPSAKMQGAA